MIQGDQWPLTGRTGDLQTLTAALVGSAGAVVVISGEAGIGKTRLLDEVAADVDRRGATVTWIRGNPSVADVPFSAVAHLLPSAAPAERFELFRGAADRLAAAGPRPLLAVDDAHAVDGSSAALVRWLHEHAGAAVALTHRDEPRPAEIEQLERATRSVHVRLDRLDRDATGALLAAALGAPVDGLTLERLWSASGGNPLYLRELVLSGLRIPGAWRDRGGVWSWARGSAGDLQHLADLEHMVDRRLGALDPAALEVVELVASGEPLAIDVLEALVSSSAITAAEAGGILSVRDEHGVTRVRLVHPVFSECVQRRLPPLRSRHHRRRLARTLEARGARDPEDLLRLADWALTADLRVDPATVVAAARRAVDLVELELAERLARAAIADGGGWEAQQLLAEALRRQHRAEEAEEVLRSAESASTTEAQRARSAVTRVENTYWGRAEPGAADAVLVEAAPGTDDGQLEALQAMLWMFEGRVADALDEAERLLSDAPDPELRLWLLSTAAFCANAAGHPRRAVELAERGLAVVADDQESAWKLSQFSWALCQARLELGDLAGAAAEAGAGYDAAVREGAALRAGGFALVRGLVSRQQGRLATAAGQLRDAVALLGDMDPYRLVSLALAELGGTLARRGLVDEARAVLDDAEARRAGAVGAVGGVVGLGRVWCDAWVGDRPSAAATAIALARAAVAVGNRAEAATAAHDAALLGAPDPAVELLGRLAGEMDGPWAGLYASDAAARSAGDAAALLDVAERYMVLGANALGGGAAATAAELYRAAARNGAALLAADRARELHALGDGLPRATMAHDELTARETQVARLAGAGRSSREIAALLRISVRTVDNHLGRAYQKLGVHTRDALSELLRDTG